MKVKGIVAIVLIVLGIVILAYSGITFTTPGDSVDFLGLRIQTRQTHFIPPILGVLCIAGGIVMLFVKPRSE